MFIAPTVGIGGMSPFKTVYPRKKKTTNAAPTKAVVNQRDRRLRSGIVGTADGSGLRSAKRKRFANVFATRFEPHVTESVVADYLGTKATVESVMTK